MTGRTVNCGGGLALAIVLVFAGLVPPVGAQGAGTPVGDDAGLWKLWERQNTPPLAYIELAEAWTEFAAGRPARDPHVPVAHTLAAWNLLKVGRNDEAKALLEPYARLEPADGATVRAAREIARAWLSCLDRKVLMSALEAYRADQVRYPEQLAQLEQWPKLATVTRPAFQDRWGAPWNYRIERMRSMPKLDGQRYSLTCRTLGDKSALEDALALPYAEGIKLRPVQIRSIGGRPPLVALAGVDDQTPPALIQIGSVHQGVGIAYVSSSLVILYDRLHWKIFPAPKP